MLLVFFGTAFALVIHQRKSCFISKDEKEKSYDKRRNHAEGFRFYR